MTIGSGGLTAPIFHQGPYHPQGSYPQGGPYGQPYPQQHPGYPPQQGYPQGHGYPPQGYPGYPQQGSYGYGQTPPPRRGPPRWLLITLGVLGGLLLVAVGVYFGLFHYTPVALHHVPQGTTVAVRVDLVEVATFGPVRRHLVPLGDENPEGAAASARPRSERVGDAVGITPSRDLRELVVCFLGDEDHIVAVVGGRFPKGKVVPGLQKLAQEEGTNEWEPAGELLRAKSGSLYVGQADDGAVIAASDEASARAALPSQQEYKRLGIPEDGAVSYAASGDLWRKLSTSSYANMLESLQNLKALDAVNGKMTLGGKPKVESLVRVTPGTNPEEAKASLYRVFTDLRRLSELRRKLVSASVDWAGEEQALSQSAIETRPPDTLRVVTPWPYDGLDRGAQSLASKLRVLRSALKSPPSTPMPGGNIKLPGGIPLPLPVPFSP